MDVIGKKLYWSKLFSCHDALVALYTSKPKTLLKERFVNPTLCRLREQPTLIDLWGLDPGAFFPAWDKTNIVKAQGSCPRHRAVEFMLEAATVSKAANTSGHLWLSTNPLWPFSSEAFHTLALLKWYSCTRSPLFSVVLMLGLRRTKVKGD